MAGMTTPGEYERAGYERINLERQVTLEFWRYAAIDVDRFLDEEFKRECERHGARDVRGVTRKVSWFRYTGELDPLGVEILQPCSDPRLTEIMSPAISVVRWSAYAPRRNVLHDIPIPPGGWERPTYDEASDPNQTDSLVAAIAPAPDWVYEMMHGAMRVTGAEVHVHPQDYMNLIRTPWLHRFGMRLHYGSGFLLLGVRVESDPLTPEGTAQVVRYGNGTALPPEDTRGFRLNTDGTIEEVQS